jgi:hypothetical protein
MAAEPLAFADPEEGLLVGAETDRGAVARRQTPA